MSEIAIRVENLGKRYRIGKRERYRTLRDSLTDALAAPFRRLRGSAASNGNDGEDSIWALKDLSFEVKRGEVIGVIGRNGAGKSTLLKVLSRITEPTEGKVEIHGRVGSLLEVGTGFHPELTGRENIYLNGAILGMKRAEINRKFDEIVAFAEVEKFLDTPVKHYSSGMYVRLAFGVAAHLEPEILVVDEVLAVGDAQFQRKCLGKMGEVSRQGRTVLLVSHNMTAIQSLCEHAVWLGGGKIMGVGPATAVMTEYLQSNVLACTDRLWDDPNEAPGNEFVKVHRVRLLGSDVGNITVNDPIRIEFSYCNFVEGARLNVSLHLYNLEEICVFASISDSVRRSVGLIQETCDIPGNFLNDGTYRVRIMFVQDTSRCVFDYQNAALFEVRDVPRDISWYGKMPGVVRPRLSWHSSQIEGACQYCH